MTLTRSSLLVAAIASLLALVGVRSAVADTPYSLSGGTGETVGGMTFAAGESFRLDEGKSIKGNVYVATGTTTIDGLIDGDAHLAGSEIEVAGEIRADMTAAGAQVRMTGNVGGDLRAAFGNGRIAGRVGGNVLVVGGDLRVQPDSEVYGSSVINVGIVELRGKFLGPVKVAGGRVEIDAEISGDVAIEADELEFGPNARINGNLTYQSRNVVELDEERVTGTIDSQLLEEGSDDDDDDAGSGGLGFFWGMGLWWSMYSAVVALIAGLLMWLFVQPLVDGAVGQADTVGGVAVLFVAGVVTSLVMLMLGAFCIVGLLIPITVATWCALAALVFFGGVIGKIVVGRLLLRFVLPDAHTLLALIVGVLVSLVVGWIPIVWFFWWGTVTCIGIGAVVLRIRGSFDPTQITNPSSPGPEMSPGPEAAAG